MYLIIDNNDPFTENLLQMVAGHGEPVEVLPRDEITIEKVDQLSPKAIFLSPGPCLPHEAENLISLIQERPTIPMLGICFGMHLIALAFGAKLVPVLTPHGKTSEVFHSEEGLMKGLPQPFTAGTQEAIEVDPLTLPETLIQEGETESGEVMAIRHRDYPIYGVQFHPESILTPEGVEFIDRFIKNLA